MSLAAEGIRNGDLPEKGYDIHCPLMGRPGINYLATSCRSRVKTGGCSRKTCKRFTGEKILQTLSVIKVEPLPVVQEPVVEDVLAPMTKSKDGKRNRRSACVRCEKDRTIIARGLCSGCITLLRKNGTLDSLHPAKRVGRPPETTPVSPPESILELDFTDEPELLLRLQRCAEQSGSTPQDEAKLFIHAYLDFLGVR